MRNVSVSELAALYEEALLLGAIICVLWRRRIRTVIVGPVRVELEEG